MVRVLIAAIVGGIVIFAWGFVFWAIGIGNMLGGLQTLPDSETVVPVLDAAIDDHGFYMFPEWPDDMRDEAQVDAWNERHEAGPIGFVMFRQQGATPMDPVLMARGIGINVVCAFFVAVIARLIGRNGGGVLQRGAGAAAFAVGAFLATHAMFWNYFYLPDNYTIMMAADTVIGWTIAGIVIALVVGGKKKPAPAE